MFIFIPPSETKASPRDAEPASLGSLVAPELGDTRAELRRSLVKLCRGKQPEALAALGLSPGQAEELTFNRDLETAAAGPAMEVYTGVLYDALELPVLHGLAALQGAGGLDRVLIFSGLWGVLRPTDRIPHYRCSAGVRLPGVGSVTTAWRKALRGPLDALVGGELVVDLRSGAYGSMWAAGPNAVTVRVLHERIVAGVPKRTVVSHFNKATKGRIARALLVSGAEPRKPDEFAEVLRELGFPVERGPQPPKPDAPTALDVVVSEL
jgi:cytoplasmic iron level regulating protein YaaA (DUF328/UPF0246 family)